MSSQHAVGDVIEVRVEKIVPRGFGLAFAAELTVLVPLTAPGDILRVRIREVKKRLAFAEILEIKQPGPGRVAAPCVYFGACGGCDFQQLAYAAQLDAKVNIVRDCLRRIARIEHESEIAIMASPQPFAYRSRARWHADRERRAVGYFRRDSHDVIDVHSCPILTPGLESTLEYVRESMDWAELSGEQAEIEAASGEEGHVSVASKSPPRPAAELTFAANGETYHFSAEVFFQANKFLIGELIEAAVGGTGGEMAFDLYCGVGLFSLPLARRFTSVLAVEEYPASVAYAKKNVAHAGLNNIKIVSKSVARFLSENKTTNIDLILIDPPRAGAEKHIINEIAELKPTEISYVSCEPSILARDLRILVDAGYVIDQITALDLFPQTHHVETVVRLKTGSADILSARNE